MIKVKTESGSVYEIDTDGKRFRRLSGERPPTARQGADGSWRGYARIDPSQLQVGLPIFIMWAVDDQGPPAAPGCIPGTMTSRVVELDHGPAGG